MCSWMLSYFPSRKWNYYSTHINITHYLFSQVLTFEVTTSQRLALDLVLSLFNRNHRRCFFSEGNLMNYIVSSLLAVKLTLHSLCACTVCTLVQSVHMYRLYTCTCVQCVHWLIEFNFTNVFSCVPQCRLLYKIIRKCIFMCSWQSSSFPSRKWNYHQHVWINACTLVQSVHLYSQ